MAMFAVDRDLPRITPDGLSALQAPAISATGTFSSEGREVHYIRSLFITGESRCLCLFEATDEATLAELNELARLPFTRIVAALDLRPPRVRPQDEDRMDVSFAESSKKGAMS